MGMKRQKTHQPKNQLRRRLGCEMLEPRHLMAADPFEMLDEVVFVPDGEEPSTDVAYLAPDAGSLGAYDADLRVIQESDAYVEQGSSDQPAPRTNPVDAVDVDASGTLTPADALLVIEHINHGDPSLTQPGDESTAGVFYTDVNGDGKITTDDAELVIKALDEGHVVRQRVAAVAGPETDTPESDASEVAALEAATFDSIQAEGEVPGPALALPPPPIPGGDAAQPFITEAEALNLLARAAGASSSEDAIIAIVDRGGRILGVRLEQGVLNNIPDLATRVFAIDGAVAKARTAAFFASNEAPLTSRTIRSLSQTTIIERIVESNPTVPAGANPFDDASPFARTFGPGTVAPIGVGGHFPPDIKHTPPVDLFNIELQSRDGLTHPGADGIKGTPDDVTLMNRFNVPTDTLYQVVDSMGNPVPGLRYDVPTPESYGVQSGLLTNAQGRGIATMPGGVPLYKVINGKAELVGGIGVFFPGLDGYATHEQGFIPNVKQTSTQRLNSNRALEAEFIAVKTAGVLGGPLLPGYTALGGRIDLVGITLEVYGPNPTAGNRVPGIETLRRRGAALGPGDPNSGENQIVVPGDMAINGQQVPSGWLVMPHDSPVDNITAADVMRIVQQARDQAEVTRAAIRLDVTKPQPAPDVRTKMVIAVADSAGNILGLFRMSDATIFSIDVAVAKARNTAYYADPLELQDADKVDDDLLVQRGAVTVQRLNQLKYKNNGGVIGTPDLFTSNKSQTRYNPLVGLAFTNRTFRFLAEPRYPSGVDGSLPPVFSILTDPGTNRRTAENFNQIFPATASQFTSVVGFDAFHASRNFHDPGEDLYPAAIPAGVVDMPLANQNGIVFFPGSTPLYKSQILVGGFGISGDGVDQDDVVTAAGQQGFNAPQNLRADNLFYRGVRLPFQKFNRNPKG